MNSIAVDFFGNSSRGGGNKGNRIAALQAGCNGALIMKPGVILYGLLWLFSKKRHQQVDGFVGVMLQHNERHVLGNFERAKVVHCIGLSYS
jgi:hypothetical protein